MEGRIFASKLIHGVKGRLDKIPWLARIAIYRSESSGVTRLGVEKKLRRKRDRESRISRRGRICSPRNREKFAEKKMQGSCKQPVTWHTFSNFLTATLPFSNRTIRLTWEARDLEFSLFISINFSLSRVIFDDSSNRLVNSRLNLNIPPLILKSGHWRVSYI